VTAPTAAFVWSIADLLRGPFKPKEYGKVILPFTVLARLDAVLQPTKQSVLDALPKAEGRSPLVMEQLLTKASGASFYNTSKYSLAELGDPAQIASNLKDYIDGFDPETREIFSLFKMHDIIDELDTHDLLALIVEKFRPGRPGFAAGLDVHPDRVSNIEMGQLFEELIRRFMESSKETAGEYFTPREVIRLMVGLLFTSDDEALSNPHALRQVYDPTCGTGGMLSVAEEWLRQHNPGVRLTLAGQERNPETYAIAKADMLIKGQDVHNLVRDDTLLRDGHRGRTFTYCLANPPFGVDWKGQRKAVEAERVRDGDDGRFAAGLPPVNDGAMLFLQHLVSKMRPAEQGGARAAIVLNGSPLFTGGAESGPSEIRRWLLTNDLVEAIIGLPTDMFYNTGISTYIWLLTNRKDDERKGKVQLIDATSMWVKMTKSLGAKRRMLSKDDIDRVIQLHGEFRDADTDFSRVMANDNFGYQTIIVERPLRRVFTVDAERIETAMEQRAVSGMEKDLRVSIRAGLLALPEDTTWTSATSFGGALDAALKTAGVMGLLPNVRKAILGAFAESAPEGELVTVKGKPIPDPSLRDRENVPLSESIDDYFEREVVPWVPDAWLDDSATKIGYEIPFTRVFYRYVPPRPLETIDTDVQVVIGRIEALFAEVKA
jgi:type I restriction enzyme M protein